MSFNTGSADSGISDNYISREMSKGEQPLDYSGGADNSSTLTFGEFVDFQAWRNTFPCNVGRPQSGETATILEIPNLPTAPSSPSDQPDKAESHKALEENASASRGGGGDQKRGEGTPADDPGIKQLVSDLASQSFHTRQKASEQLEAMGVAALPYLKEAVSSGDLEVKRLAQNVVDSALAKYAEPKSFSDWLETETSCHIDRGPTTAPDMLRKKLTPDQATARSEALKALSAFKKETGYGSFEASKLDKQAAEWSDMIGTLGRVTELKLSGKDITDDTIANIKNFPNLKILNLACTGVTDKALENLKDLSRIRELNLTQTAVTDKGLEHLKDLKNLESLHLADTKITDSGTAKLKNLKYIETLDLTGTKVTDKTLDNLKELQLLKTLNAGQTEITDEAMRVKLPRVKRMTNYE